jgi:Zn finger protein HypA/HybF involved in hydrogenase expression
MGASIIAFCECGYQASFLIGGGMMNFMTVCNFPALCNSCQEIVQVNLLSERKLCPKCKDSQVIPYDDKKLVGKLGKNEIVSWNMEEQLGRVLRLTDGIYLCPSCEEYKLRFEPGDILFD